MFVASISSSLDGLRISEDAWRPGGRLAKAATTTKKQVMRQLHRPSLSSVHKRKKEKEKASSNTRGEKGRLKSAREVSLSMCEEEEKKDFLVVVGGCRVLAAFLSFLPILVFFSLSASLYLSLSSVSVRCVCLLSSARDFSSSALQRGGHLPRARERKKVFLVGLEKLAMSWFFLVSLDSSCSLVLLSFFSSSFSCMERNTNIHPYQSF